MKYFLPFLLLTFVQCSQFDLFLDYNDVESLMGLSARLYYVRHNQLNLNAMQYPLEVPSFINTLNLTWSTNYKLLYKLTIQSDKDTVLPKLNSLSEGDVPNSKSTFTFTLSCLPNSDIAIIKVLVQVSENWQSDSTNIHLRFKKFCVDNYLNEISNTTEDNRSLPLYYEQVFFYYMIAGGSILIGLAIICCLISTYHRDNARNLMIVKGFQNNEVNTFLKSALNSSNKFNQKSLSGSKSNIKDLHECIVELSIQRQRVRLLNIELEGTFGRVYKGSYTDINGEEEEVFVKTVTDQASAVQISVLLHEGLSMYGLNHKNILTIQGVSVEQHVEPFLLYPYNNNKNLKKFLQTCKTTENLSCTLTTREIIDMTLQIISGMQYLHKNRHLHKDVAARNCLINQEFKVLITDNALSRDLFPSDYHCLGDNKNRPIKWMAIESLEHKKFSTASDIWSFGILLWELLTLCQQPYADIDPFEMSAYLQDGFRLNQPVNCPDELFTVMACCWALAPNERPTFSQLFVFMNEFNNQLVKFV
ncbi:tyrosine-protein kinase RYK-like [Daktulosphaira vitifoliae]|uniref:tyrosine-protein kinase RYK-like n=1 Tax=Daktulosphaira vitifoliae TaxID=58002 RepID=UPI0021AA72AF|nr:tyrosine-protein kinase RYK-like [Daktulosphaira vitifoliae]